MSKLKHNSVKKLANIAIFCSQSLQITTELNLLSNDLRLNYQELFVKQILHENNLTNKHKFGTPKILKNISKKYIFKLNIRMFAKFSNARKCSIFLDNHLTESHLLRPVQWSHWWAKFAFDLFLLQEISNNFTN